MKTLSIVLISLVAATVALTGCKKSIAVECVTKMRDVVVENKNEGATFTVKCPAACTGGSLYGTDTYTTDSSVCAAGIHAGVIPADKGGNVVVKVVKGLDSYATSERNGLTSTEWKTAWGPTAFTVSK